MASIKIQVLSVTNEQKPTAKGSYGVLDIAYKNLTFQGKVEGKKIMSFGASADTYKVLNAALPGQAFEIDIVKNDKGYNDWVKVVATDNTAVTAPARPASSVVNNSTPAPRSNYETPEERAQRQVYIIRQSSISSAVSTLVAGAKSAPKTDEVLALAKAYENYVMGTNAVEKLSETFFEDGGDSLEDVPL